MENQKSRVQETDRESKKARKLRRDFAKQEFILSEASEDRTSITSKNNMQSDSELRNALEQEIRSFPGQEKNRKQTISKPPTKRRINFSDSD